MSHYHAIQGTFIWSNPLGCGVASPEEMDNLSFVKHEREIVSFRDFVFEARCGITSCFEDMIADRNKQINDILAYRRTFDKHRSPLHFDVTEIQMQTLLQDIKRLKGYLQLKKNKLTHNNLKVNDKELAKQIPISNFIDFKFGFSKCLWHNEKHGSMKLYKEDNHVWCFSCQKYGDTIDVVQAINGCDFKTAIKIILNK